MKILIVGAGLSGIVVARELSKCDKIESIDIIESRNHIGGNLYDYKNSKGVSIHKYGPHIWHTNDEKIHSYMSEFTEWIEYKHKVKALLDTGDYVTIPANQETKKKLNTLNYDVIETLFRPYSEKMWGITLEELNPDIINRVPIRDDMNEYYFPKDRFQGLPKDGYMKMLDNMLTSDKITIHLNTKFQDFDATGYGHIFNSMPIDEHFDYSEGTLDYRSIKFHNMTIPNMNLPVPCINFTDTNIYTRVTDWKNFPGNPETGTSDVTFEEPCDFKDNNMLRFYPLGDDTNKALYRTYSKMSKDNMSFIGRCGIYQYLDMDKAVKLSLHTVNLFIDKIQ